jgi:membrane protein implicated in regulation of membrane protease activity
MMRKIECYYWFSMVSAAIIMTLVSIFLIDTFYNIFFNICLGLFIGGLFFSAISFILGELNSEVSGEGELSIDTDTDFTIDTDMDLDVEADINLDVEADMDLDVDADVDVDSDIDTGTAAEADSDLDSAIIEIAHAPAMLLLSASLLVYGISGIILYFIIAIPMKFIIFFATPVIVYINSKLLNYVWKNATKSRFYSISSTENLIGKKGEVVLKVDDKGGVIKVPSNTPMKFERIHVKPLIRGSNFESGEVVYVCDIKDGFLLVDKNKNTTIKRRE